LQTASKIFLSARVAGSKTTSPATIPAFLGRTSIETDVSPLLSPFARVFSVHRIRPRPSPESSDNPSVEDKRYNQIQDRQSCAWLSVNISKMCSLRNEMKSRNRKKACTLPLLSCLLHSYSVHANTYSCIL